MKKLFLFVFIGMALSSLSFKEKSYPTPSVAGKLLAFPVAGFKSKIGSFWGADRDGGARKHKGIDIFAKKGTPVVAVSDGVIVEKAHTGRGGKVLWLKSKDHSLTAYYAHLDKHLVKKGQRVKKGQVLGTVGNTGNARTTPAHLHFGIYKSKRAVNPLPYVKNAPKIAIKKNTQSKTRKAKSGSKARK